MKYAKIIDKGECYSTTNMVVNGVPANKYEWAKYNFYPKNDMVGEVIVVNGRYVLKINEDIYVPMSGQGIVEISEAEYLAGKKNNVFTGMDERQQKINDGVDAFAMFENTFRNPSKISDSPYGQDAEIYFISFRMSASKQGESIQYRMNYMAQQLSSSTIVHLPYYKAVDQILEYVRRDIIDEGWSLSDIDGVTWFLGLYATAYVRALGTMCLKTDHDVFVDGFIKYFEQLNSKSVW